jgi:hypothetical protein
MSLISPSIGRFQTALVVLFTVPCSSFCQAGPTPFVSPPGDDAAQPPLEISFKKSHGLRAKKDEVSCGVPEGRDRAYDPATGIFHVHFRARNFTASGFEVTKVAERFTKPVVFQLMGVPSAYGCLGHPLTLSVDCQRYALDASCASLYCLGERPFDEALFRSERKGDVVTVEFTEKGQALLKPGAQISLEIDTGW